MNDPDKPDLVAMRGAVRSAAWLLAICLILGLLAPASITRFYLLQQDLLLLGLIVAIAALSAWRPGQRTSPLRLPGRTVTGLALAVGAICYLGHYWLLSGYALTRDEQMALFDAQVFASGRLTYPLPADWQSKADLLNTMFMPSISSPVAWISGYLPGNAMIRAAIGRLADPNLTGPIMTATAVPLTWLCARRLWPHDGEPAAVATLLVALSGQAILTGMTAYAMPAHLALNLLWLWLFLGRRWSSDLAALAVGFVATGLHQPIFHPLFVAPWLALLLWRREWGRVSLYAAAYLAIGLFWLAWPHWQSAAMTGPSSIIAASEAGLVAKLAALVGQNGGGLALMGANLVRFFSWQPLALLPLCILGWIAARRDPQAAALAGGFVLILFACVLLMAFQGHGFGYRYFHGLIGSAALLAGYGWRSLGSELTQARAILVRSLVAGSVVLLPVQAWYAHSFYAAYAKADRRIATSGTDFVLIGSQDARYAVDLVFNRPDLSNRPIRIVADLAQDDRSLAAVLCRKGASVALPSGKTYAEVAALLAAPVSDEADRRAARIAPALSAAGCQVKRLD